MGVSIRLQRLGSNQKPHFRVVATDAHRATQGKSLEGLGIYDPLVKDKPIRIDTMRVAALRRQGATMTPTVARIIKRATELRKTE